jgi:hypothetical protein
MAAPIGGEIFAGTVAPAKASVVVGTGGAALGVGGGIIASPIGSAAIGNTVLTGKGVCLGLGLGLGAWGPVILGIAGLAGAASLYKYLQNRKARADASAEPA